MPLDEEVYEGMGRDALLPPLGKTAVIAEAVKQERERIRQAIIFDQTTGAGDYSDAEEYANKIVGK